MPLLVVSTVKENFGSKNKTVLDSKTIIKTNITGRIASKVLIIGLFAIFTDFSNELSLHIRIPKIKIGKNIKKRISIILKMFEINKNPRNEMEEKNNRRFVSFENRIIKG